MESSRLFELSLRIHGDDYYYIFLDPFNNSDSVIFKRGLTCWKCAVNPGASPISLIPRVYPLIYAGTLLHSVARCE